jgi:hypothetical protein
MHFYIINKAMIQSKYQYPLLQKKKQERRTRRRRRKRRRGHQLPEYCIPHVT